MRFINFLLISILLFSNVQAENMRVKIGTELANIIMKGVVVPDNPAPVGPHEDPNKCICKGSGWITQGDGHKSKCPYHYKNGDVGDVGSETLKKTCNCKNCDCKDCGCLTGECPCFQCVETSVQEDKKMPAMTSKQKYDYIIYHMGADWCGPCRDMLHNVWPNSGFSDSGKKINPNHDMKDFLSEHRIRLILLDSTIDKDKPYFRSYGKFMKRKNGNQMSYPTILMFSVENYEKPVLKQIGGPNKNNMMKMIREVIHEESN